MKKIILVFGAISGVIVSLWLLISTVLFDHTSFEYGMIYGFASMILALSLIFVAIKSYRDNHNNGEITFLKALQIGLLISLVASTVYVFAWMVDYYVFIPDFMDTYTATTLDAYAKEGHTSAEIEEKTIDMYELQRKYKNPVWVILFTYMEILPVGILISLIAAALLKRKRGLALQKGN